MYTREDVGNPAVEGGPKSAELPDPDPIARSDLLEAVDIPTHLSPEQRTRLEKIIVKNEQAFGLDGRLGEYQAKVTIPLKPDAKEVCLPPYAASPAKREVIDKQLDSWISLGVIEPSTSPWGFSILVVYRNNKAWLCVDYRKLNAITIADEYPLPRQSDIIQALSGAQYLTTLDALASFTQIEIEESDRMKTVFRTHRGLFQF